MRKPAFLRTIPKFFVKVLIFLLFLTLSILSFFNYILPKKKSKNYLMKKIRSKNLDRGSKKVIIIFNPGGWGNTRFQMASDWAPVVKRIKAMLNSWGYDSVIISYNRTKDGFIEKIKGIRNLFTFFQFQARELASQIDDFLKHDSNTRIIITGLSLGAMFTDEVMKKIPRNLPVYAIEAGVPFWYKTFKSNNILRLKNKGDSFAEGHIEKLIFSMVKACFKWIFGKITFKNVKFSRLIQAPGHKYDWNSPEVGLEITRFLEERFYFPEI